MLKSDDSKLLLTHGAAAPCVSKKNRFEGIICDEYLGLLIDLQWKDRENKKIYRLLKQVNFRQNASLGDISYASSRNLDKNMLARLGTFDFLLRKENIIICVASGTGKSYLSKGLGHQACLSGIKTLCTVIARIIKRLKLRKVGGTYLKELGKLTKVELLILDDFGLQGFDN